MRASTLFVLLLAGCGKPAAVPDEGPQAAPKTPPKAGSVAAKVSAVDLITHNLFAPKAHPAEGKRVLVLVPPKFAHMAKDGEGKPCLLLDSQGGFSRPLAVFRLAPDSIFADGKTLRAVDLMEADFVGHVSDSAKWFAPWASMDRPNANGQVILFDNARIVTE